MTPVGPFQLRIFCDSVKSQVCERAQSASYSTSQVVCKLLTKVFFINTSPKGSIWALEYSHKGFCLGYKMCSIGIV